MRSLRSVTAVIVGLLVISVIAEGIEFVLVTALHGGVAGEPDVYFSVRNRPLVLGLKLIYNTLAAGIGGFVAAWIAGRQKLAHGIALAAIQLALFIWGMTASEFAGTTPTWAWSTLCVTMTAAIVFGAHSRQRLRADSRAATLGAP